MIEESKKCRFLHSYFGLGSRSLSEHRLLRARAAVINRSECLDPVCSQLEYVTWSFQGKGRSTRSTRSTIIIHKQYHTLYKRQGPGFPFPALGSAAVSSAPSESFHMSSMSIHWPLLQSRCRCLHLPSVYSTTLGVIAVESTRTRVASER